jgi:hypothetical protein
MSRQTSDRLKRARKGLIDVALMRADARPEMVLAGVGVLIGLILALILFGAFPSEGVRGPISFLTQLDPGAVVEEEVDTTAKSSKIPSSAPPSPTVYIARSGDAAPQELYGLIRAMEKGEPLGEVAIAPSNREWVNKAVCSANLKRTPDERLALVYYVRNHADLCHGLDRGLILSPLTPGLTALGALFVSVLLLVGVGVGTIFAARFLRRVRRAYRRLYVSEHRADHDEAEG